MEITIIAAVAENGIIGRDNALPWRLPSDLARFKKTTMGHGLLMGWNTWRSIAGYANKPLPGRNHYIVSRRHTLEIPIAGCTVHTDITSAIREARKHEQKLFVIGGAQVYQACLALADTIMLTKVHAVVPGDAFFPPIDLAQWRQSQGTRKELHTGDEHETSYETWRRFT